MVARPRFVAPRVNGYDAVMPKVYGMASTNLTMAASTQARISSRMPSMPSLRMNCDTPDLRGVGVGNRTPSRFHHLERSETIA